MVCRISLNNVLFFFLIFILTIGRAFSQEGYKLEIKINGLKDTTIILGHHFNASMYPDDTIRLNNKGYGIFQGGKKLPGGMYLIFLPNQKYFDILLDEDQHLYLETDTSELLKNMIIKGSDVNTSFFEYQLFMLERKEEASIIQNQLKESANEDQKKQLNEELSKVRNEVKLYTEKTLEENKNNFFGKFLLAVQEVEVPPPPKDENGNIIDSLFQAKYYRKHFFDNFDISDPRLLRTPIYESRIKQYIEKVIPQVPDSIIPELDMLIEKSRTNEELFRFMLVYLFNYYAKSQIMGMDKVFIHIAENYYIDEATWSAPKFIEDLKETVKKQKPLLIGEVAQDFQVVIVPKDHFIAAEKDTALKRNPYVGNFINLHQINAKYLILYFWEADCSHCKKATPEMYEVFQSLKDQGVVVLAVHMLGGEEGKEDWIDFVNKHKLYDWINAWNPYSYEYKIQYDLKTTPVVFVLDKEKKIIAKKISAEQVKQILTVLIENEKE